MKYCCDYCGQKFDTVNQCMKHEDRHKTDDLLAKMKPTMPDNAIVCPDCNGTGDSSGTDGADVRACYTCDGKRFVIPETKVVYHKINDKGNKA